MVKEPQLARLDTRLRALLSSDSFAGSDGSYVVNSLYFDDYKDSCARENDYGTGDRFKWRIRRYGTPANLIDPPSDAAFKLERKEKKNARCHKAVCRITSAEVIAILSGDASSVFWNAKHPLLRRFCLDVMQRMFAPKAFITYERTAFVDENTHIRITFDRNIMVAADPLALYGKHVSLFPINKNYQILEVKFDTILPGWLHRAVEQSDGLLQSTWSKYYLGRQVLDNGRILII